MHASTESPKRSVQCVNKYRKSRLERKRFACSSGKLIFLESLFYANFSGTAVIEKDFLEPDLVFINLFSAFR